MKKLGLAVKTAIAAVGIMAYAVGPAASAGYVFGDVSKGVRASVCAFHAANPPKHVIGHYAFAINAEGDSCGWTYGLITDNFTGPAALNICQITSTSPCEILHSK